MDREAVWKILRHYEDLKSSPLWFVTLTNVTSSTNLFGVPISLPLCYWLDHEDNHTRHDGIQWTLLTQLNGLDFADNLAALSHYHSKMQYKTTHLASTFNLLQNTLASKNIFITTRFRILNSNVKSKAETWRTAKTTLQKIKTFYNTCLRLIFTIHWPERIKNEELLKRAGQEPMDIQIWLWNCD